MPTTLAGTPLRQWLRPPRNLLVLFLITTLGFLIGLGWLGWRSLEQDEDLEAQRIRERLEGAADLIAAEVRRNLGDLETQLERFSSLPASGLAEAMSAYALRLTDDALIVAFDLTSVQTFPRQRLLYYPVLPAADEPYRFVPGPPPPDDAAAVEFFQVAAQSDDNRLRAEALFNLARTQLKLGRSQAALETLRRLNDPDVLVEGRPAELLARIRTSELLSDLGATADFRDAVQQLDRDLHSGRWQLTRPAYLNYQAEVRRLKELGGLPAGSPLPTAMAQSLAAGVDFVWRQWQDQGLSPQTAASQTSRFWNGKPVFLMWRATADRFVSLIAGPMFLQDRVVEPLRSLLDRQGVGVALFDGEGQTVLSHGVASTAPQRGADRSMLETRLPWTVRVVSANPDVERAQFSTKRQLVIAGLVFLALFVVAGSYLSVRAMTREMEAVRLKSDFVAAVSHEFRTPLTLLRQFSDLLAEDRVSNEQERRRYYAAIQRGTRRLTRLVEDLLDFGRMEAGSRSFRFERVDVQSWFMKLTGEFEEEIRSKGYRVDVEYTCLPGLVVKADEEAIGRALWNLLDNAVKYSPTVKTIWVSAAYEDGRVILRVRDRGIGVPLEEQRQIFRKFVRGSATNTQVVKGTGLGLALVEQIVEAHSGVVRLESVAGEGSTFSISLPVEVNQQEQNTWLAS